MKIHFKAKSSLCKAIFLYVNTAKKFSGRKRKKYCTDNRVVEVTNPNLFRATCRRFDLRIGLAFVWSTNSHPEFGYLCACELKVCKTFATKDLNNHWSSLKRVNNVLLIKLILLFKACLHYCDKFSAFITFTLSKRSRNGGTRYSMYIAFDFR